MNPDNIIRVTDPTGWEVVGVRISNAPNKIAWVYREDYERIVAQYPGKWTLSDTRPGHAGYVRVRGRDTRSIYVARIVAHAPHRSAISFWDGDPLNIRGANISVGRGCGGVPKRKKVPHASLVSAPRTTVGDADQPNTISGVAS
jgi:hypothetical protein